MYGIEQHDDSAFVYVMLFRNECLLHSHIFPKVKGFLCEVKDGLHPGLKEILYWIYFG